MTCYNPISAWQTESGFVVFNEMKRHGASKAIKLPCGQCTGCRLERSRQWAMRCVHEAQMHKENCFITLTYNDDHLPRRGQLKYSDFQKFMKRLRKKEAHKEIRFYMGAEYGEENARPHYHACIFGHDWPDKVHHTNSPSGEKIYTSKQLQELWPYGYSSSANVTFKSAAYIARYCLKKVTGKAAEDHYRRFDEEGEYQLIPEFNKMSLKPAIGKTWLEKYKDDVYNYDHIIINGAVCSPPKYYDKLLKRWNKDRLEELKEEREQNALVHKAHQTPERLAVRETVHKAQISQLKRNKI